PYWPQIKAAVDAERAIRARAFLAGGTDELLGSLHPTVRWEAPVLRIVYPVDADLFLQGRGLRLVPSYFCREGPITLRDTALSPVLVYPVQRGLGSLERSTSTAGADTLARLLGRTRAATLSMIAEAENTTGNEIARRLDISPASASEHAAVLRDAGLIRSLRVRNTIRHAVTPLGVELLEGRALSAVPGRTAPGYGRTGAEQTGARQTEAGQTGARRTGARQSAGCH
ncbi:ArsR/SmtB family transcription factor, partial [Streptomyces sp. NPDC055078]